MEKKIIRETFEEDMRGLKKIIRENNLPHCEEVEEMELIKKGNGEYEDHITAQMYQVYLMGIESQLGILSMIEDMDTKKAKKDKKNESNNVNK